MNLTALPNPGLGYVLADKLNRARAFSLSLSNQAKPYIYNCIFLPSKIASGCQQGMISSLCWLPAVSRNCLWENKLAWTKTAAGAVPATRAYGHERARLGAVLCVCLLYQYRCSLREPGTLYADVCTYQEAGKRDKPTDPEDQLHTYVKMQTHICCSAHTRSSSNGHTMARAPALLVTRRGTMGPRQQYV